MKPTLSYERFSRFIEERNDTKAREMYREVLQELSTAKDALAVVTSKRVKNAAWKNEVSDDLFEVYAVTSGGRLWKGGHRIVRNGRTYINHTGWYPMDKSGKITGPPIGHLAFRKLPLAKKGQDWIRLSRPEGPWRRYIDCVLSHVLFGNGKVLATDGVHALFQYTTAAGKLATAEVMFQSLTEIAVPSIRRSPTAKPVNKTPKEPKLSRIALDLL